MSELVRKRIGNDLVVRAKLTSAGSPENWDAVRSLRAWTYSDAQRVTAGRCSTRIIEGGATLQITYGANEPQYLGPCRLMMSFVFAGRRLAFDAVVAEFVDRTAEEDEVDSVIDLALVSRDGGDVAVTIDRGVVNIKGDKGDKGDAFTYSDFTPDQLAALKGDTGDKGDKGDKGDSIKGDKGDKGDAFTYSDFTPAQLATLKGQKGDKGDKGDKGEVFTYSDFTPDQLAALKGEKGDAFTYDDLTDAQKSELAGELGTFDPLTEADINAICI